MNNSKSAPCRMQKEVAAQNSYLASVAERKEVVYKAPCDVDKPAPAKVASADVKAPVR